MNLRWATAKQQCRNRTNNRRVIVNRQLKTIAEIAEQLNLSHSTISKRIARGETGLALIAPSHECRKYQSI